MKAAPQCPRKGLLFLPAALSGIFDMFREVKFAKHVVLRHPMFLDETT
jgi:hypothetical protein